MKKVLSIACVGFLAGGLVMSTTNFGYADHVILLILPRTGQIVTNNENSAATPVEDGLMVEPREDAGPKADLPENTRRKPDNSRATFSAGGLTVAPEAACEEPGIGAVVPTCR